MSDVDRRGKLDESPFDYRATKDGRVLLYRHGKQVKMLAGAEAQKFLARIEPLNDAAAQLLMAKATGHFRHGNERQSKESN
jgi:hypothetical protein